MKGFKVGNSHFQRGHIPWNKGLRKESNEKVALLSLSSRGNKAFSGHNKGLCVKCGKYHPHMSVKPTWLHTPEVRAKMAKSMVGKRPTLETRRKRSKSQKAYYANHPERRRKLSKWFTENIVNQGKHQDGHPLGWIPPEGFADHVREGLLKTLQKNPTLLKNMNRYLEKARSKCHKKNTHLESVVEATLNLLGLVYVAQFSIGRYRLDFAIPERKIAICCDGCFWHCCPKHFPMAKSKSQQQNLANDKRRERYLMKRKWLVVHIWECEVANATLLLKEVIA